MNKAHRPQAIRLLPWPQAVGRALRIAATGAAIPVVSLLLCLTLLEIAAVYARHSL